MSKRWRAISFIKGTTSVTHRACRVALTETAIKLTESLNALEEEANGLSGVKQGPLLTCFTCFTGTELGVSLGYIATRLLPSLDWVTETSHLAVFYNVLSSEAYVKKHIETKQGP